MGSKKKNKFTVKSYKTIKGRQLFFIKSKTKIKSCSLNNKKMFFQYKSDDPRLKECSIKYKYNIDDVKLAEKQVKKAKTKNKKIWSWVFLALNIAIVSGILIYQFCTGEAVSIGELFSLDIKWWFLIVAILLVLANNFVESLKTFDLIYITTHRIRPFLSYKSTTLCRYYDAISPMSTAGEPFQIYYLKKRGIRSEVAASIPIVKSIFWQISNAILGVTLLIFNSKAYASSNPLLVTVAWISISVNALILLTVLFLSVSKKVAPRIVIGILKLLSKMKIIKNYQLTFRKVMRFVINYQNCMRTFASNFFTVITQIALAMGELLINALIPYFIYIAFVPNPVVSAIDIITMTFICNLVSTVIPIPGGSGVAEFSFIAMFSNLFKSAPGTLVWAMLIWRILSYYQIILQGITVTIYDTIIGNKKADKLVASGYFNEKIHFAMIRKKKKRSQKVNKKINKIKEENLKAQKEKDENILNTQIDVNENTNNQVDVETIKEVDDNETVKINNNDKKSD